MQSVIWRGLCCCLLAGSANAASPRMVLDLVEAQAEAAISMAQDIWELFGLAARQRSGYSGIGTVS